MIFFAAGDQGIRLVIDESLIAKKMKILSKTYVMYIKKKLRTCRIQIQVEKV